MKPIKHFWRLIKDGDLQMTAAALSFTTVLSLIPFLAVILATIQAVDGLDALYPKVESFILSYLKGPAGIEGVNLIRKAFSRVHAGQLGVYGAVALILTSMMLINEMDKAIHRVWGLTQRRPFYKRLFVYWFLMILIPVGLAVFVAIVSLYPVIESPEIIRAVASFLSLFCLYRWVPNTKVHWLSATIGATVTSVCLFGLFTSFRWLSQSFFNYGKIYGGLASIPAFLLYVLLTWSLILIGAALTASLKKS